MRSRRRSGGFNIIELSVAIVIAALVLTIPILVMSQSNNVFAREIADTQGVQRVQALEEILRTAAASSRAIFTPDRCGVGDGDGTDAGPCSEVRFYQQDNTGNNAEGGGMHIFGFAYNQNTHTVTECLAYGTNTAGNAIAGIDGPCVTRGRTFNGITQFTVDPKSAPVIAAQFPSLAGDTAQRVEPEIMGAKYDPTDRVVSGNRVVVVNIASSVANREIDLSQVGTPVSLTVLKGAFTPPQLGTLSGPQMIDVYTSSPPATGFTYTETNYEQYLSDAGAQPWSASACIPTKNGVPLGAATLQQPPSGNNGVFEVTTGAFPGQCVFNVVTADQTLPVTVNVYNHPAYQLTVSGGPAAAIFAGGTTVFEATATIANASTAPPGSPPAIDVEAVVTSGPCTISNAGALEPSGSAYAVGTTGNGTCVITVSAVGAPIGATVSAPQSYFIVVSAVPTPSPTPTPTDSAGGLGTPAPDPIGTIPVPTTPPNGVIVIHTTLAQVCAPPLVGTCSYAIAGNEYWSSNGGETWSGPYGKNWTGSCFYPIPGHETCMVINLPPASDYCSPEATYWSETSQCTGAWVWPKYAGWP